MREGIALVCGGRNMRDSRNGARMRSMHMPDARIIRAERIERIERGVGQRATNVSQMKHWIQRNRQTRGNHINQQASFNKEVLARLILIVQAILSNIHTCDPITTAVQP